MTRFNSILPTLSRRSSDDEDPLYRGAGWVSARPFAVGTPGNITPAPTTPRLLTPTINPAPTSRLGASPTPPLVPLGYSAPTATSARRAPSIPLDPRYNPLPDPIGAPVNLAPPEVNRARAVRANNAIDEQAIGERAYRDALGSSPSATLAPTGSTGTASITLPDGRTVSKTYRQGIDTPEAVSARRVALDARTDARAAKGDMMAGGPNFSRLLSIDAADRDNAVTRSLLDVNGSVARLNTARADNVASGGEAALTENKTLRTQVKDLTSRNDRLSRAAQPPAPRATAQPKSTYFADQRRHLTAQLHEVEGQLRDKTLDPDKESGLHERADELRHHLSLLAEAQATPPEQPATPLLTPALGAPAAPGTTDHAGLAASWANPASPPTPRPMLLTPTIAPAATTGTPSAQDPTHYLTPTMAPSPMPGILPPLPIPSLSRSAPAARPLSRSVASRYLVQAGGDKARAKQLAADDGYDPMRIVD